MCGIAGFLHTDRVSADERIVRRMTDLIAHRGPDASGFCVRGEVALGHRRLSIIDLTTGGQPMSNEDDSLWITYNGEIFNHADVRPELEAAGHRYKSHCDTETCIHAYEQWGYQSVTRYRGMFAYAIWDDKKKQLFCVRDRLGIKPFYYFWDGRLFAFASEIKVLLEHPDIRTEFNDTLLPEYLAFGYVSGVFRHPQAHARTYAHTDLRRESQDRNQTVLGCAVSHALRQPSRERMDHRVPSLG